jgi:hypothetical protein
MEATGGIFRLTLLLREFTWDEHVLTYTKELLNAKLFHLSITSSLFERLAHLGPWSQMSGSQKIEPR